MTAYFSGTNGAKRSSSGSNGAKGGGGLDGGGSGPSLIKTRLTET